MDIPKNQLFITLFQDQWPAGLKLLYSTNTDLKIKSGPAGWPLVSCYLA